MFKSLSTSMIWRGILAIAVGIIALAWPAVSVNSCVRKLTWRAAKVAGSLVWVAPPLLVPPP